MKLISRETNSRHHTVSYEAYFNKCVRDVQLKIYAGVAMRVQLKPKTIERTGGILFL